MLLPTWVLPAWQGQGAGLKSSGQCSWQGTPVGFGATQVLAVPPPTLSLSLGDTHRKEPGRRGKELNGELHLGRCVSFSKAQ